MGTSMQKVGSEIGSGNGVLDEINGNSGSLGNFIHQAGSDAAAGFMAQAHKGALSKTEDRLSRENQIIASTGNAENDMRSTVAKGMGARKAFDDGMGAGFMKQTETDTRAGIESQEAKSKLYSPEEQIDAARVKAAAGLTNDVGTTKELVASGAFDSKGGAGKEHGDYESGIGYQSRKQANQTMALGKGWSNMSEEAKSNLMGKVQTNTNVAEFGGINATHAEIMKHGSEEKAMEDMVTNAMEKGIESSARAKKLRKDYGNDLNGLKTFKESSVSPENQAELDKMDNEIGRRKNTLGLTKDKMEQIAGKKGYEGAMKGLELQKAGQESALEELKSKRDQFEKDSTIETSQAKTLSQVKSSIAQSKIDSEFGQAVGVDKNYTTNPNIYAQNAQYSEMQKQQTTDAKISTQGGVANAVAIDALESSQKASQQKGAVSGLEQEAEKIGEKIGKSAAGVIEGIARDMSGGKLQKDHGAIFGAGGSAGYMAQSYKSGIEGGAKLGTGFESAHAAASMAGLDTSDRGVATFMHNSERAKETRRDAFDNLAAAVMGKTGMGAGTADAIMGAGTLGIGGVMANSMMGDPAGKLLGAVRGKPNSIGDSKNKTQNNSTDQHNAQTNESSHNKSSHSRSPYTNFAGQPTSAHPSNKSILSRIGKKINNPFTIGGAAAMGAEVGLGYLAENTGNQTIKTAADVVGKADTLSYAAAGAIFGPVGAAVGAAVGFAKDVYDGDVSAAYNAITGQQSPAPQHKGFTTLPMGHNTLGAMEQHFTATQQQNAQAMSNISPTSRYVGFSATDADGNQVNFSTSKSSQSISCGQGLKKR